MMMMMMTTRGIRTASRMIKRLSLAEKQTIIMLSSYYYNYCINCDF